jgi:methionine synthase II (cobalamin-independent)
MTIATGVGSMPGEDDRAYAEAVRLVLGELPDLPHVPELPGRGATATMTGRALAVVAGIAADLQPAVWRLTDASGVDHRRARSLLAQDLDQVEEQAQGYAGTFKTQVTGPWTLAATVEKPRGDKVLSDHGARRDLAQALAEGLSTHVADLRRRLPGVDRLVVQVDEPALAAVVGGRVPTASGYGRHRSVDLPEASAHLEWVLGAVADAGAEPWVHSCAPQTPWSLVAGAGARGLSGDLSVLGPADLDAFAEALESGSVAALGVVPSLEPEAAPSDARVTERVQRWLDMLGLDPESLGDSVVITPTCGLAGASAAWARSALGLARTVARNL